MYVRCMIKTPGSRSGVEGAENVVFFYLILSVIFLIFHLYFNIQLSKPYTKTVVLIFM